MGPVVSHGGLTGIGIEGMGSERKENRGGTGCKLGTAGEASCPRFTAITVLYPLEFMQRDGNRVAVPYWQIETFHFGYLNSLF